MTIDVQDFRVELDLGNNRNLIENHSGEYGLTWRNWNLPAEVSDTNNINGRNGTLTLATDGNGDPYFVGTPNTSTPTIAFYRTTLLRVKPWVGEQTWAWGAEVKSPVGGATDVSVYINYYDTTRNYIGQNVASGTITAGSSSWTTIRGSVSLGTTNQPAYVELVIVNTTSSISGKVLHFRQGTIFKVPAGVTPSTIPLADTNAWTDIKDSVHKVTMSRGNRLAGANEQFDLGIMGLELRDTTYSPQQNSSVRVGLRGRVQVKANGKWYTRFIGTLDSAIENPPRDGQAEKTQLYLRFVDDVADLNMSKAPVLYDGSFRQRVAQCLGLPYADIPFNATDLGTTILNVNKKKVTESDDMTRAEALELIRNSYMDLTDFADIWLDRGGHVQARPGQGRINTYRPLLFVTRKPVTSSNMAESDVRINQFHNRYGFSGWQVTTPTNTFIPMDSDLGNDQKAHASNGETVTAQVNVYAQQNVRVIPQTVLNGGTVISETAVDLTASQEQTFIWDRLFDATDAANGVTFQFKFEKYGTGGALTITGDYAFVSDPLVMVGSWTSPEQYFDNSDTFTEAMDGPTGVDDWTIRDLSTPRAEALVDGLDIAFDTTGVVNRMTITHKGVGGDVTYGPYFNRLSVNEWGARESDFAINRGTPKTVAGYVLGKLSEAQVFPSRVRWRVDDNLDRLAQLDINDVFGVLHNDQVIDCRVLALEEVITAYSDDTKNSYIVTITPKPFSQSYDSVTPDLAPVEEQSSGGEGTVPVENQNVFAQPTAFYGRQTVSQNIANGTWTAINLTVHDVDTDGGHSTATNTHRFTFQRDGYYEVSGGVGIANNTTGNRGARLALNGTVIAGSGTHLLAAGGTHQTVVPTKEVIIAANAGDYVTVEGYQNSGATRATYVIDEGQSSLTVKYLRPL